jgi:DnaJ-class molecular chaperone
LGLEIDSDLKQVKSKYKLLAKKWHPDLQITNMSKKNYKDKFVAISNAYKTILKSFTEAKNNT